MSEATALLNIATWERRSYANGPGCRFVVWLQGCPILCPGCVNQDFLPLVRRNELGVDDMLQRIAAVDGIEGVTFSGGEPTAQAQPLALLAEGVRDLGLTLMCYSGYTVDALRKRSDPWVDRLLASTDILIDGPYVESRAARILWRGSTNQRVLFLSDAYRHLQDQPEFAPAEVEMVVDGSGFLTSGTWPDGFLNLLNETLRAREA